MCHLADRVRIDIPDETDVDFKYHGEHGMILSRDAGVYGVALDDYNVTMTVREDEIRPPFYWEIILIITSNVNTFTKNQIPRQFYELKFVLVNMIGIYCQGNLFHMKWGE